MRLKNHKKIFLIVILTLSIMIQCNVSIGAINLDDIMSGADSFVNGGSGFELSGVKDASDAIYSILLAIGGVVAICVGVYLGVKFITSTVEEKAKVKESLIAYIVGCIIIFGAFGIWKLAVTIMQSSTETIGQVQPEQDLGKDSTEAEENVKPGESGEEGQLGQSGQTEQSGQSSQSGQSEKPKDGPTKVSLSRTNVKINLEKTNSAKLEVTLEPNNIDKDLRKLKWKSSNETIATVSNGKIKGLKKGKVTITVETVNGKTASCQVEVEKERNVPKITGDLSKIDSADSCKVVAKSGDVKLREVISNFNSGETYFQNFAITDDFIYLSKVKQRDEKGNTYGGERVVRINREDNTYEVMRVKNAGHMQGFDVANRYSSGQDIIIMNYFSTNGGYGQGFTTMNFQGSYDKLRKNYNTK